ncbi:MAG: DUF975 family protein [Lachnospiraceae bacterium]|nr:DUF975 family protein [Lachnospiraceae bacterium]
MEQKGSMTKAWKRRGREHMKRHYMIMAMIGIVVIMITGGFSEPRGYTTMEDFAASKVRPETGTVSWVNSWQRFKETFWTEDGFKNPLDTDEVLEERREQQGIKDPEGKTEEPEKEQTESEKFWERALGRTQGVFAKLVNGVTTGSFYISLATAITSIVGSPNVAGILMVVAGFAITFLFWMFVRNVATVSLYRILLEGRMYKYVGLSRILFLMRVKKWIKASVTMLVYYVLQTLLWFTIVGGFIARYSYYLVPMIVAENPDIGPIQAMKLSRAMMMGHKKECFRMEISFIGWHILSFAGWYLSGFIHIYALGTLAATALSALYIRPYIMATNCEYYADRRKGAIEDKIPGTERLNETYLYELPSQELIEEAYEDVIEIAREPVAELSLNGFPKFMADWWGITFWHSRRERAYEEYQAHKMRVQHLDHVVAREEYPIRLGPLHKEKPRKWLENIFYIRHYSIWSLTMLFFTYAFIGWIWEVGMHAVQTGEFVNRGVMHGPWLPIYGAGAVMTLVLLNRIRPHPFVMFFATTALCGSIEYVTSWYLEQVNGVRWWDYTGYFLNINGRVCAEGLLLFGIGCTATVYLIGPILDNLFARIPYKVIIPIALSLLLAISIDQIYSRKYPNLGKGITSGGSEAQEDPEAENDEETARILFHGTGTDQKYKIVTDSPGFGEISVNNTLTLKAF